MAFLDWIKSRGAAAKQQPVAQTQQKPETAKQMYAREAIQDAAARKPVSQMLETAKAEARSLGAAIQGGGDQPRQNPLSVSPSAGEGATSPQPMRQNMVAQHDHPPA